MSETTTSLPIDYIGETYLYSGTTDDLSQIQVNRSVGEYIYYDNSYSGEPAIQLLSPFDDQIYVGTLNTFNSYISYITLNSGAGDDQLTINTFKGNFLNLEIQMGDGVDLLSLGSTSKISALNIIANGGSGNEDKLFLNSADWLIDFDSFQYNNGGISLYASSPSQEINGNLLRIVNFEQIFVDNILVYPSVANRTPTATGETVSTSKNTAITVELGDNVSDPDTNGLVGATLNVTSTSNGVIANIDQDAQLITFTPNAGFSGTASFKYTITDAGGLTSSEATVTVNVGEIISTGNQSQTIQGNEGNDYISAGNGKDTLLGLGGNDTLIGNNGADTLNGGSGNDVLNGGNGSDLLTGGTGRDKFVIVANAGGDTITDFSLTDDWIQLSGGLTFGSGNSATDITQSLSGSDVLLYSSNQTLLATLQNVGSFLSSSNFVYS